MIFELNELVDNFEPFATKTALKLLREVGCWEEKDDKETKTEVFHSYAIESQLRLGCLYVGVEGIFARVCLMTV